LTDAVRLSEKYSFPRQTFLFILFVLTNGTVDVAL